MRKSYEGLFVMAAGIPAIMYWNAKLFGSLAISGKDLKKFDHDMNIMFWLTLAWIVGVGIWYALLSLRDEQI